MDEQTYIIINDKKIYISSDLVSIFTFLMHIIDEVRVVIEVKDKLKTIANQHIETLNFLSHLIDLIKENNLDFKYTLKEHPETMAQKLEYNLPARSLMIMLFAVMETHRVLWTSYVLATKDEDLLKNASNEEIDKFIRHFFLTSENSWFKENTKRSGKISVAMLRDLRNSLTHFYSVSYLTVVNEYDEKMETLSKQTNYKFLAISPNDLYELIKSASMLMLKEWDNDCRKNPEDFKNRIRFTLSLVDEKGAVVVNNFAKEL